MKIKRSAVPRRTFTPLKYRRAHDFIIQPPGHQHLLAVRQAAVFKNGDGQGGIAGIAVSWPNRTAVVITKIIGPGDVVEHFLARSSHDKRTFIAAVYRGSF